MKILITGAAGFIGKNLSAYLTSKGHNVIGIDDFSNSKAIDGVTRIDIGDRYLKTFFQEINPDCVIHLAAMGSISRCKLTPDICFQDNVVGFLNVFESVYRLNRNVLMLYASSSSVYPDDDEDDRDPHHMTELEMLSPDSAMSLYGSTKILNEMIGRMGNAYLGVKSIGLRFFNVFGPGQRWDVKYPAFIPIVLDSLYNDKYITLFNSGNNTRDYTPVQYVVRVIERLLHKHKSFGEPVLNIGLGDPKSCVDIISRLERITGKEAKFNLLAARPSEKQSSKANTYLLDQLQVEKPHFNSCLLETVKYYQEQCHIKESVS